MTVVRAGLPRSIFRRAGLLEGWFVLGVVFGRERRQFIPVTSLRLLLPGLLWVLWSLAGCDRKEVSGRDPLQESGVSDSRPLPLDLDDELVALQVRGESPGGKESGVLRMVAGTPVQSSRRPEPGGIEAELEKLEPGREWESENRSAAVVRRLHALFASGEAGMLAESFVCSDLRPARLKEVENHGGIQFLRPEESLVDAESHHGWEGFAATRADWLGKGAPDVVPDMSVKVLAGQELDSGFSAEVMVELRSGEADGVFRRQVTTSWYTRWTLEDPPRLASLQVRHYEESLVRKPGQGFVDVGPAVLGGTPHYREQVLRGTGDWATRLTRLGDFSLTGHHGLAVGDVNGDGLEDLYVCDAGSLPNRLYVQQPDGTVEDTSAEAGVNWLEDSRSALLVDLDNDGDEDLVVATIAMVVFLENDGTGIFSLRGGHPGARYPFSLSAADFDSDGLLDIYVCVYSAGDNAERRGFEVRAPLPFNDAENGGSNVLLKNLGMFGFADATEAVGLGVDNTRWSFGAAWEDYDRDGDPDLYVANDFGRNCFYRNEGGHFRQIAGALQLEDMASGMSVAWGDYNRDGAPDLYVGNMFSAAGNRVSRQEFFKEGADAALVGDLRRMARGNSLFAGGQGEKGTEFQDVSEATRSHLGQWAWSSGFGDLNNDGWEDLVISNGFLTGREPDDL